MILCALWDRVSYFSDKNVQYYILLLSEKKCIQFIYNKPVLFEYNIAYFHFVCAVLYPTGQYALFDVEHTPKLESCGDRKNSNNNPSTLMVIGKKNDMKCVFYELFFLFNHEIWKYVSDTSYGIKMFSMTRYFLYTASFIRVVLYSEWSGKFFFYIFKIFIWYLGKPTEKFSKLEKMRFSLN